jgi:hypothetical protein
MASRRYSPSVQSYSITIITSGFPMTTLKPMRTPSAAYSRRWRITIWRWRSRA